MGMGGEGLSSTVKVAGAEIDHLTSSSTKVNYE